MSTVKPRSAKRIAAGYGPFVAARLARSRRCEVGARIVTVDPLWRGCTRWATGLHHLRKRSASGRLVSRLNTLRSCDPCNGWAEDNPDLAIEARLVIRPGDPWWPWLGRRLPSGRKYP